MAPIPTNRRSSESASRSKHHAGCALRFGTATVCSCDQIELYRLAATTKTA